MIKNINYLATSNIYKTSSRLIKPIISYMKNKKEVLECYIFGSVAKAKNNNLSDIDIAIYIQKKIINENDYSYGYKAFILSELISLLSNNHIDLVILNEASPLLYHRVVSQGIRIYSKNSLESQKREYRNIQRYLDFKPLLKMMQNSLKMRIDNNKFGVL